MDGVSREMEVLRRNQREALEIKGTVAEMNAFDGLTGRPRFIALCFIGCHRHWVVLFFFFFLNKSKQPSCIEAVYLHHSSNSICSLFVSVSYCGNSHNISNFFHYYLLECYIVRGL